MEAEGEGVASGSVPGALVIPGYAIDSQIGRGGFATVFSATQTAVGGRVAIKVINATDTEPDVLLRFERESQAMGALRGHPHIVTVLDAGHTDDRRPYIVMELVESGSLHDDLVRGMRAGRGALPVSRVLDLGVKVASAVAAAHSRGILHRDLKPGNILLSDYDEPLLTDFGVARLADHDASVSGQALSAGFTAPEIIRGAQPTVASDVFSLGSTLHTLLTGSSPFRRAGDAGLLPALNRTVEAPAPDLRPHGVPDLLCRVLETAMAKDPAARHPDMLALGLALQQAQRELGLPVSTAPFPQGPGVVPDQGLGAPVAAGAVSGPGPEPIAGSGGRRVGVGVVFGVLLALGLVVAGVRWLDGDATRDRPSGELAAADAPPPVDDGAAASPVGVTAFDRRNPLVLGSEGVTADTEDPVAEALVGFYGLWGELINTGELAEVYDLYTPAYQEDTPFDLFTTDWAAPLIHSLVIGDVVRDDEVLLVDLTYLTTSAFDDDPEGSCVRRRVIHVLVAQGEDFRIDDDGPEDPPEAC